MIQPSGALELGEPLRKRESSAARTLGINPHPHDLDAVLDDHRSHRLSPGSKLVSRVDV